MGIPFQKGRQTAPGSKPGSNDTAPPRHSKPKGKNDPLLWLIAGAMIISALSFFPSLASVLLVFAAVCAAPVPQVADWLSGKLRLTGKVKAAAMAAALFAAALTAPTDPLLPAPPEGEQASVIVETEKPAADSPADAPSAALDDAAPGTSGSPDKTASSPADSPLASGTDSPHPPAAAEEPSAAQTTDGEETGYVGSISSDKYHDPDCRWAKKILPENEIWFSSKEEAQAAGYSPCGTCQ